MIPSFDELHVRPQYEFTEKLNKQYFFILDTINDDITRRYDKNEKFSYIDITDIYDENFERLEKLLKKKDYQYHTKKELDGNQEKVMIVINLKEVRS